MKDSSNDANEDPFTPLPFPIAHSLSRSAMDCVLIVYYYQRMQRCVVSAILRYDHTIFE